MTQIKSIILITWTHTQVDVFFFMGEEENVSHYFSCSWHYEHKHLVNSDFPGKVQNNNKINKTQVNKILKCSLQPSLEISCVVF